MSQEIHYISKQFFNGRRIGIILWIAIFLKYFYVSVAWFLNDNNDNNDSWRLKSDQVVRKTSINL